MAESLDDRVASGIGCRRRATIRRLCRACGALQRERLRDVDLLHVQVGADLDRVTRRGRVHRGLDRDELSFRTLDAVPVDEERLRVGKRDAGCERSGRDRRECECEALHHLSLPSGSGHESAAEPPIATPAPAARRCRSSGASPTAGDPSRAEQRRSAHATTREEEEPMAKVLCVLYDDPVDGYPPSYARDDIPDDRALPRRADDADAGGDRLHAGRAARQRVRRARAAEASSRSAATGWSSRPTRTAPTRSSSASCPDAEVVISQPFWPAYLTAERIAKAPNLKLAITAGIGSDHVDLQAAIDRGLTVAEVTYCNSISVAEHVVMLILVARAQLPAVAPVGARRRLEHRRLRLALVRPRGHAGRHRRRRPDRLGGAPAPEAVRRRAALHRPAPPAERRRAGARRDLPPGRRPSMVPSATW